MACRLSGAKQLSKALLYYRIVLLLACPYEKKWNLNKKSTVFKQKIQTKNVLKCKPFWFGANMSISEMLSEEHITFVI